MHTPPSLTLRLHRFENFNHEQLAKLLQQCIAQGTSGIAFHALDHPLIAATAIEIMQQSIPVLTLLSDLHSNQRHGFIGTDNRMAGRAAGLMMGHFVHGQGTIAVLWASSLYRTHDERESGFRSLLRSEFPSITVLDHISGHDDPNESYQRLAQLLAEREDIIGVYNVGSGTSGVIRAIRESGRRLTVVGHNLTDETRQYLLLGDMQAIIHQSIAGAASQTLQTFTALATGKSCQIDPLSVEIVTRENLPVQVDAP